MHGACAAGIVRVNDGDDHNDDGQCSMIILIMILWPNNGDLCRRSSGILAWWENDNRHCGGAIFSEI